MTADDQPTTIAGLRHGQLCYLQIPAADAAESARFYERVFGWHIDGTSEFEAPALIGQWVPDRPPAPDAGALGWIHVADLEAAAALYAAGVRMDATAGAERRDPLR